MGLQPRSSGPHPLPGTKTESAKMGTCLRELCEHNPCTQTVKHIQDLEFLLWHLIMSFNEATGNEVVIFFSFGLSF